jgi:hypothetical protein
MTSSDLALSDSCLDGRANPALRRCDNGLWTGETGGSNRGADRATETGLTETALCMPIPVMDKPIALSPSNGTFDVIGMRELRTEVLVAKEGPDESSRVFETTTTLFKAPVSGASGKSCELWETAAPELALASTLNRAEFAEIRTKRRKNAKVHKL